MRRFLHLLLACSMLTAIFTTYSRAQDTPTVNWSKATTSAPITFSNDGSTVLIWDGFTARAWSSSTFQLKAIVGVAANSCTLWANGNGLYYTTGAPTSVYSYSFATNTATLLKTDVAGYQTGLNLAVSADGTKLCFQTLNSAGDRYYMVILNTSTGTQLGKYGLQPGFPAGQAAFCVNDTRIILTCGPQRLHPASGTSATVIGARTGGTNYFYKFAMNPSRTIIYGHDASDRLVAVDVNTTNATLPVLWTASNTAAQDDLMMSSDGNSLLSLGVSDDNVYWAFRSFSTTDGSIKSGSLNYATATTSPYFASSPLTNQIIFYNQIDYPHIERWSFSSSDGSGTRLSDLNEGAGGQNLQTFGTNAAPRFSVYEGYGSLRVRNSNTGDVAFMTPPYDAVFSPDGTYYVRFGARPSDNALGAHIFRVSDNSLVTSYLDDNAGRGGWGGNDHIWIGNNNNLTARVFDFNGSTLTLARTFDSSIMNSSACYLSTNGLRLFEFSATGNAKVWNVTDGTVVATINPSGDTATYFEAAPQIVGTKLMLHEWRHDGSNYINQVTIRDMMVANAPITQTISYSQAAYFYEIGQARINPAGTIVAITHGLGASSIPGIYNNEIKLYRVGDGALLKSFNNQLTDNSFRDAAFTADGSSLLVQSFYGNTLAAINVQTVLSTLTVSPTSVIGGSNATGTVTISRPAPAGGIVVSLGAESGLTVPATVTITEGNTSANFTINTSAVDATGVKTLGATYDGFMLHGELTVQQPNAMTITFNPTSVSPGQTSTGTVTLNGPAGPSGATVNLSSNKASVTVPSSVHIAAGTTSKTFTANTTDPGTTETATVTGTWGDVTGTGSLTVASIGANVAFDVASITGGNALVLTITMGTAAPTGGATFTLTGDAVLTPIASVTVPAGQTTVSVGIDTKAVSADTLGNLTVTRNGSSKIASATITVPTVLAVYGAVTSVTGVKTVKAIVVLNGPAPTGGLTLAISLNNATVTAPANVTIPAGQHYATFDVTTKKQTTAKTANVTVGGKILKLNLRPAP